MPKYTIYYTTVISSTTFIEADNEEEAREKFKQGEYSSFPENEEIVDIDIEDIEEE